MDPGTVINPLNAKAQIQGAALWGTSQVMAERLTLKDGALEQSNFHDYQPIRLVDVPPIDVELIDSGLTRAASGSRRPRSSPRPSPTRSTCVGVRVRHMPITAEAVLQDLRGRHSLRSERVRRVNRRGLKPRPIHMGNSDMLTKSNTLSRRHDFILRVARTGTLLAQLTPVGAGWSTNEVEKVWALDAPAPKTERASA